MSPSLTPANSTKQQVSPQARWREFSCPSRLHCFRCGKVSVVPRSTRGELYRNCTGDPAHWTRTKRTLRLVVGNICGSMDAAVSLGRDASANCDGMHNGRGVEFFTSIGQIASSQLFMLDVLRNCCLVLVLIQVAACATAEPLSITLVDPKTNTTMKCTAKESPFRPNASLSGAVETCAKQLEAHGFVRVD